MQRSEIVIMSAVSKKCTWMRAFFFFFLVLVWKSQSACGETTNETQTSDLELRDPDAGDLKDDVIRVGDDLLERDAAGLSRSVVLCPYTANSRDTIPQGSPIGTCTGFSHLLGAQANQSSHTGPRSCPPVKTGLLTSPSPTNSILPIVTSSYCGKGRGPSHKRLWEGDFLDRRAQGIMELSRHPGRVTRVSGHMTRLLREGEGPSHEVTPDAVTRVLMLRDTAPRGGGGGRRGHEASLSHSGLTLHSTRRLILLLIETAPHVNLLRFLFQAMQIDMLGEEYNYLFMSLDFHVADLSDFIYAKANITALRIVDVDDPVADIFQKKIDAVEVLNNPSPAPTVGADDEEEDYEGNDDDDVKFPLKLETENAMLYDAVKLFALSVSSWGGGKTVNFPSINCRTQNPADGTRSSALRDIMKKVVFDGLTGTVKFDESGFRKDFQLYITELGTDGLEEIGTWSPKTRLNITKDEEEDGDGDVLRVAVMPNRPFVIMNNAEDGSPEFSGFCVDLLRELSTMVGFKYELHMSYDSKYGSLDEDGHWTGMIGELIDGKADLAMTDLTITEPRERAVDFTLPFMTTGLAVVTKKSAPMRPGGIWSFFLPLTREVWVYVILATACTIFVMYISARLSFREWTLVDDGKGEECMENRFNLFNCFLFVVTTLLHQRITLDPRAPATRVLAGFWYFFTFIIIAIVVSNLCESILWEDDGPDYDTAQEMLKARGFTYIAVEHGSTQKFLQESKVPLHQRISSLVERNYRNLPASVAAGLQRVKDDDKVAFIMEHASATYATQEDCNFSRTDPFVYHSAYGIATPRGSPYRSKLSEGILKLQEDGRLQWIQQRWWNPKRFCDVDQEEDGDDNDDDVHGEDHSQGETVEIRQLHGADLAGAFAILYLGFILAGLLAIGELFYVFSTRANRDTHLNSIAVSDHMKQAGYVWKRSMDLSDMRM
ncbi:unnamed protein product [Ixodes hexagonus]